MNSGLHVETIGNGEPLVLLHGWGWNSRIWQPLIPQLSEKFQLILIDLPGFGESTVLTKHYNIDEIVVLLLEAAPSTANWLGWSLGGMVAWYTAIHFPERVARLITVASSPKFISAENWPGVPAATLAKFAESLEQDLSTTLREFLELQLRGSANSQALLVELEKQITPASPTVMQALRGGLKLLETLDLRSKISQVQCPSLHIFGSHDTLVPTAVVDLIQPQLKNGRCEIIKRSGHMPFLSQPQLFIDLLLD